MTLDGTQLRVLGSLMEKEITTPENYPLSLNALLAACNQRSSREPVLDLREEEARQALHMLEDMEMVAPVRDARVAKYEHRIRTVLNLRRDETALLCLLLLRGPQTPGELRGRAERMFRFDDLAAVQSALERMASRTAESEPTASGPLVVQLARQPGSRESRYAHLLGGPVETGEAAGPGQPRGESANAAWAGADSGMAEMEARILGKIEAEVEARIAAQVQPLREAVATLHARVDELEAQKG